MCMFEELLVCHFNVDDERGYVICTDRDAFEGLDEFVSECRSDAPKQT